MSGGEAAAERALVVVGPGGEVLAVCASWKELSARAVAPGDALDGLLLGLSELGWRDLLAGRQHTAEGVCQVELGPGKTRPVRVSARSFAGGGGALVVLEPPLVVGPSADAQQLALDRIRDAILVADRDWRVSYLNRSAETYLQHPRAELVGQVVWDVFPEVRGTELEQELRESMASKSPRHFQLLAPSRKRWVEVQTYPSTTGLSVYFHDITEERAAAEALKESELRYRSLVENSLDAILLNRPNGEVLEANPEACRLLGRTVEEIRGAGRDRIFDPRDPRLTSFLEERQRRGRARGEVSVLRKDGTRFDAEVSSALFRDASGRERASLSFRALGEFRRGDQALRFMAEAGQVLAGSLDYPATLQRLATLVVPRLASLCFLDLADAGPGHGLAVAHCEPFRTEDVERLHRGFSGLVTRAAEAVIHSGEPELVPLVDEAWLRRATRDPAHLAAVRNLGLRSVVIVPLRDQNGGGEVMGALTLARGLNQPSFELADVALATGIADWAALALHNARLYGDALAAKASRDELLGFVSHDLRNPLTTVKLNTQLLQRLGDNPRLQAIARSTHRAERLIDDLLVTAKIDAHSLQLSRKPEDLGELLQEVNELHRTLAEEAGVGVTIEAEPNLPRLDCDRHRVVQLLSNLLSNALQFTGPGGHVAVRARRGPGQLWLTVEDDGPGIAAEDLPHLFDRFWQGSHAGRAGAGLGLAICKGIADAHGWTLSVESAKGHGTRFTVAAPLAPDASESAAPPA